MPLLLPSIIANSGRVQQPFVLVQSSIAQTCLPILRTLISESKTDVLLFSFLHRPSLLVDKVKGTHVQVHDLTDRIPGYSDTFKACKKDVLQALRDGKQGP